MGGRGGGGVVHACRRTHLALLAKLAGGILCLRCLRNAGHPGLVRPLERVDTNWLDSVGRNPLHDSTCHRL